MTRKKLIQVLGKADAQLERLCVTSALSSITSDETCPVCHGQNHLREIDFRIAEAKPKYFERYETGHGICAICYGNRYDVFNHLPEVKKGNRKNIAVDIIAILLSIAICTLIIFYVGYVGYIGLGGAVSILLAVLLGMYFYVRITNYIKLQMDIAIRKHIKKVYGEEKANGKE